MMRVMLGVAMAVAVTVMIKVAQCVVHQHAWRSMCLCVPSARHSKNWTPGVCAILRLVPSPTPLDPTVIPSSDPAMGGIALLAAATRLMA